MEQNSYTPESVPLYNPEVVKIVDTYMQSKNSILEDSSLTYTEKEELLANASLAYHAKVDPLPETQQAFAWWSLMSEDESLDFTWAAS